MGAVIFFRVGSGTLEERHCTIRPLRVKPCCCCVPKPVDHARGGAAGAREHCSCVFLSASAVPRRRALAERERGSAHDDSLENARTLAAVVRLLHARPVVQLAAGSVWPSSRRLAGAEAHGHAVLSRVARVCVRGQATSTINGARSRRGIQAGRLNEWICECPVASQMGPASQRPRVQGLDLGYRV